MAAGGKVKTAKRKRRAAAAAVSQAEAEEASDQSREERTCGRYGCIRISSGGDGEGSDSSAGVIKQRAR